MHFGGSEWRDHWKHCAYFLEKEQPLKVSERIEVICSRDEYSVWFKLGRTLADLSSQPLAYPRIEAPACECELHTWWRPRLCSMNDSLRNEAYISGFEEVQRILSSRSSRTRVCACYGLGVHLLFNLSKVFDEVHLFEQSLRQMCALGCFVSRQPLTLP